MSIFSARIVSEQFKANMRDVARNAKANFKRFFLHPLAAGMASGGLLFSTYILSNNTAITGLEATITSLGVGAAVGIAYATYNAISKGTGQTYTDINTYEPRTAKQMNRALQKELLKSKAGYSTRTSIESLLKTMESYGKLNVFEASAPFVAKLLLRNRAPENGTDQNHSLEMIAMIAEKVPGILAKTTPAHLEQYLHAEIDKPEMSQHLFRQQEPYKAGTAILDAEFLDVMGRLNNVRPDLLTGLTSNRALSCAMKLVQQSNFGYYRPTADKGELEATTHYLLLAGKIFNCYPNMRKAGDYLIGSALEHEQEQIDAAKKDYKKAVQIMMDVKRNGAVIPQAKPDAERSKQTLQTLASRMKSLRSDYSV